MSDIYGRKIAQAAAKFCSETGEYILINAECMRKVQRPSLVVNKAFLRDNGISMECIRDCIEQLEAFGDVDDDVKDPAGVETYGGSYNTGMVITSKKNPKVNCVVTLNSGRDEAAHDLYLEWYYDVDGVTDQAKNQTSFIEDFQRLTSGKSWLNEGIDDDTVEISINDKMVSIPRSKLKSGFMKHITGFPILVKTRKSNPDVDVVVKKLNGYMYLYDEKTKVHDMSHLY